MGDDLINIVATVLKNSPNLIDIIRRNRQGDLSLEVVVCHAAIESSIMPDATGLAGEIGLFQLKSSTAKSLFALFDKGEFDKRKVYDPELNTKLGTQYLHNLYVKFDRNLENALGAYKQGASSIRKNGLSEASQRYVNAVNKCADRLFENKLLRQ